MREMGRDFTVAEPIGNGEFRYIFYGEALKRLTGADLAGKTTAHQAPRSGSLARRNFLAVMDTLAPMFTLDRDSENGRVHLWGRLHLPLRDNDGGILIVTYMRPNEYTDGLLRDILDAAADGILAVKAVRDSEGGVIDATILAANAPILEMLHMDQETLMASTLLQSFPEMRENGIWRKHLAVIESRQCKAFESKILLSEVTRWHRVVSAPMGDGLVISFTDITELKQLNLELEQQRQKLNEEIAQRTLIEQELWNLAHIDALTGTANRRSMQENALATLTLARKKGVTCTMIGMDIDFFKTINDTYGHAAGDLAIQSIASIARTGLRGERDVLARMGGEEFSMLLYDTSLETGVAVAERLRRQIEKLRITAGTQEFGLTVSFGVAVSTDATGYEELMAIADNALYSAKRAGRNCTSSGEVAEAA